MTLKYLDKLVLIHIECAIWSGRKKLKPEDLRLPDGSTLPPSEVASLGSKKICDPEALNHFERLKKEAQRQCEQVGVRFLGGYAIPDTQVSALIPQLERIAKAFQQHKHLFLANYDQVTRGWVEKHPDFADAIKRAIAPIQEVKERFAFDYTLYRMKPARRDRQLEHKVAGMGDTLFEEVAREANELFRLSIAGRHQLSQRGLNPLRRIQHKLGGLAFLDYRIQPLVGTIDQLLQKIPATGAITGSLFHELVALILILTDPHKMRLQGEGQLHAEAAPSASPGEEAISGTDNPPVVAPTPDLQTLEVPSISIDTGHGAGDTQTTEPLVPQSTRRNPSRGRDTSFYF